MWYLIAAAVPFLCALIYLGYKIPGIWNEYHSEDACVLILWCVVLCAAYALVWPVSIPTTIGYVIHENKNKR